MKEKTLLELLDKKSNIVIYGAGMVGGLVFKRLTYNGISKDRISFVVSSTPYNSKYMGCKVTDIHNTKIDTNSIIIVSTLKENQNQIIKTLIDLEINNYYIVDDELYEDMEAMYVDDYSKSHGMKWSQKEIMFMASDNNHSSGAFLCLVDLNKELNKRGISTLIILPMYGTGEDLLIENNLDYTYVLSKNWLCEIGESKNDLIENEIVINRLENLIRQLHIRLVHNNTTYTYVGAEAARRTEIPYIWHIREYIREQGFWFLDENNAYNMINDADVIIPVSEYVANCYEGFKKEKIRIVYEGIDIERYLDFHEFLPFNKIKILMPGNISTLKGQKQLVLAAIKLKEKNFNFEISFVGNGDAEYIEELKSIVFNNNLENSVKFYDRTNYLEKWYQKSDIVVVCSRSEAFGRVTVEAQLAGCLVIGAKCGATQELINNYETGVFFELENPYDLADKIAWAINHKTDVKQIINTARENTRINFSKEKNAEMIVTIYRDILSKNVKKV